MAIGKGTDVQYIGSDATGGMCVGQAAATPVGFYGTTPVVQLSLIHI